MGVQEGAAAFYRGSGREPKQPDINLDTSTALQRGRLAYAAGQGHSGARDALTQWEKEHATNEADADAPDPSAYADAVRALRESTR